jgi:hypothetical protein
LRATVLVVVSRRRPSSHRPRHPRPVASSPDRHPAIGPPPHPRSTTRRPSPPISITIHLHHPPLVRPPLTLAHSHHQSEKQYNCAYCSNRFKNKNEAERHQNSLHLRLHSWSCATLDRAYESVFHPCTAVSPHANPHHGTAGQPAAFAQYDICGYCGLEFPNHPAPDWVARSQHLTNVHKFGECNQSKKFFRADHFRQHLKHSHAGTSGKWTNMLETACMKQEPPLTPEALSKEQMRLEREHHSQMQGTALQASQLQAAQQLQAQAAQQQMHQQGAPVAPMMGIGSGLRQGPYPAMPLGADLQYQRLDEDIKDELQR